MSKTLLIAGAGALGRETYQWALDLQKIEKKWDSIGFLDDNVSALDKYNLSDKLVGTIEEYKPKEGEEILCAIGDPVTKAKVYENFLKKGSNFATLIHPTVTLSERYTMGKDIIVGPGAIISIDVKISDSVVINSLSIVGHDVTIEKGCIISDYCDLMGNTYFGENVFLGGGAKILPGVRVMKNAKVGAGSVVIKNIKEDTTVFGNPAKVIYSPKK